MSEEWELQICCMGAGYVGGPTMAVIAKQCPKVRCVLCRWILEEDSVASFCQVTPLSALSVCWLSLDKAVLSSLAPDDSMSLP
jgi:hypothetical protein